MERSGASLDRAFRYYGILRSNISTPAFREIDVALAPQFADYSAKITQNQRLFSRIKSIYEKSLQSPLVDDQQRVVELTYKSFEMNGAALDSISKARYADINRELSSLYTTFSNNVLHDEENYVIFLAKTNWVDCPRAISNPLLALLLQKGRREIRSDQYAVLYGSFFDPQPNVIYVKSFGPTIIREVTIMMNMITKQLLPRFLNCAESE